MTTRDTAIIVGRLLALIEFATDRDNDPVITEAMRRNPAATIAKYTPSIIAAGYGIERRWVNAMGELSPADLPTAPLTGPLWTDAMLAYWQERIAYRRGQQLFTLRERAGLTQQQWADRLGVSVQTIRAWEQHARTVPEEYVELAKRNPEVLN